MKSVKIVEEFKDHLVADGKSPRTVMSYVGDIKGFMKWLEQKTNFDGQLNRLYITSYKSHLVENNFEVNTINKKINSLHSFNSFLVEKKLMKELIVDNKKDKVKVAAGSEGEVEVFTENEVEQILFYLEDRVQVCLRDKVVIQLLLFTGVRCSELVGIKLRDLDFLTLQLRILGKGGKTREVPLKNEVVEVIKEYLQIERKEHKHCNSEYLLLTQRAERMDKDTINKLLRKHGKALKLVMKPHKFRHTFCTRLLKKGVEITTVAKLAGHASIHTTAAFYINTSRQEKMDAVNLL